MTNISQKIIFFGTEDFSAASLQALIEQGYSLSAVVTKPDTRKGRGKQLTPPLVKTIAATHNIPVWQPTNILDIESDIRALQPVAGVLVSFGKIIPQSIIDLFTPGIINVHPSKLPMYRGPSPIEAAILHGDNETGVTLMKLAAKMDAGPTYCTKPFALTGTETQSALYSTLARKGAELLIETLPAILDASLHPIPQDETQATYCRLLTKDQGVIDWTKPAQQIEREIRAYLSWPQSRTTFKATDLIITSAHVVPSPVNSGVPGEYSLSPGALTVRAGQDTCLAIDTVKPVGKKEMPIQAFLSGYRSSL